MIGENVKIELEKEAETKRSRVILALDTTNRCGERLNMGETFDFTQAVLEATKDYVVGIKIGYPLILKLGLEIVSELIDSFGGVAIADVKLADIGNTNKLIVEELLDADFKGIIAHAFQGKDTLISVAELLREYDLALFLIASMSNPGAKQVFKNAIDYILQVGLDLDVTGFIAPATRPDEIRYVREKVGGDFIILSPGVGAQGGNVREALSSGADYVIAGRSIYCSDDVRSAAMKYAELSYEWEGSV